MKGFAVKSILVIGMIFWGSISYSQEKNFQLTGRAEGIDTGLVNLYSFLSDSTNPFILSGVVSNGKFSIHGKIPHPIKVFLALNNSFYTDEFFIDAGSQHIYFDASSAESFYRTIMISGSLVNDEYIKRYQEPLAPYYYSLDSCYVILDSLSKFLIRGEDLSGLNSICKSVAEAKTKIDSVKRKIIAGHPSSFISLWALYSNISEIENLEFVSDCFEYLDDELKNSVLGKNLAHRIKVEKVFLNGEIFPELNLADSVGNSTSIKSKIRGKYTLIDFWFSKCGPCIAQFPTIRYLYSKYSNSGFDVIGISVDKLVNKQDWLAAIGKYELNWQHYWDVDKKIAGSLFIDAYPTSFLLDHEGRIIKKNILLEELEIFLSQNLN